MQIILVTLGSFGDVYPFIWMAGLMKGAGHNPVVITQLFQRKTQIRINTSNRSPKCSKILPFIDLLSFQSFSRHSYPT